MKALRKTPLVVVLLSLSIVGCEWLAQLIRSNTGPNTNPPAFAFDRHFEVAGYELLR